MSQYISLPKKEKSRLTSNRESHGMQRLLLPSKPCERAG